MDNAALARFERFVSPEPNTGCWLWTGATTKSGHGTFFFGGGKSLAHVVAYRHWRGPTTPGLVLDHIACDTPSCVNPWHLRETTNVENVMRGQSPAAQNARKTHCIHGHAFTPDNTRTYNGKRDCVACQRAKEARRPPRDRSKIKAAYGKSLRSGGGT